jgi:hypothetical protein
VSHCLVGALDEPPADLRPLLAEGLRLAAVPAPAAAAGGSGS